MLFEWCSLSVFQGEGDRAGSRMGCGDREVFREWFWCGCLDARAFYSEECRVIAYELVREGSCSISVVEDIAVDVKGVSEVNLGLRGTIECNGC